jgi:hypothetical protein
MLNSINTDENRLTAIMLLAFGYLSLPLLGGAYLYFSLSHNHFPPNADAVAIPFAGFLLLWVVCFPVFVTLCFAIEIIGRRLNQMSRRDEMNLKAGFLKGI